MPKIFLGEMKIVKTFWFGLLAGTLWYYFPYIENIRNLFMVFGPKLSKMWENSFDSKARQCIAN